MRMLTASGGANEIIVTVAKATTHKTKAAHLLRRSSTESFLSLPLPEGLVERALSLVEGLAETSLFLPERLALDSSASDATETHGRHSSVPRPSYDPTRAGAHRERIHRAHTSQDHARVNRSSRSRAPTRASTLYPDDSISNANGNRRTHLPYRFEDCHQHGTGGYPPTLPNNSGYGTGSRHDSRGTRRSCTLNSGPAYGYISSSRSQMAPDMASRVSSSTVTHPFAYDAAGVTHTWHP